MKGGHRMKQRTSITIQEETIKQLEDLKEYYQNMIPSINTSMIVEVAVNQLWKDIIDSYNNI